MGGKKLRKFILQDSKEAHENSGFGHEIKLVQSVLLEKIVIILPHK